MSKKSYSCCKAGGRSTITASIFLLKRGSFCNVYLVKQLEDMINTYKTHLPPKTVYFHFIHRYYMITSYYNIPYTDSTMRCHCDLHRHGHHNHGTVTHDTQRRRRWRGEKEEEEEKMEKCTNSLEGEHEQVP